MPIYEYRCARCGGVTAIIEKRGGWKFWRRRCDACGSMRVRRIYSVFSTAKRQSMGEMIDEMRRLGPVNFVPAPPPHAPPPGGCPYAEGGGAGAAAGDGKG
jgi:putative FmdB family regulatory protein